MEAIWERKECDVVTLFIFVNTIKEPLGTLFRSDKTGNWVFANVCNFDFCPKSVDLATDNINIAKLKISEEMARSDLKC